MRRLLFVLLFLFAMGVCAHAQTPVTGCNTGTGASTSCSTTTAIPAGSLIVCGVMLQSSSTAPSFTVTDNKNSGGYTSAGAAIEASDQTWEQLFYKPNSVATTGTTTFTQSPAGSSFNQMACEAFSGMATSTPLDGTYAHAVGTTGTTLASGTVTVSASDLVVGWAMCEGTSGCTAAANGFTSRQASTYMMLDTLATSSNVNAEVTQGGNGVWEMIGAAFKTTPTAGTPSLSSGTGTYNNTLSITITDAGVTICYTTNGSTPTAATAGTCDSNGGVEFTYSTPVAITATGTVLEAIGTESGDTNSAVASATYTLTTATPSYNNGTGTYTSSPVSVTISDATTSSTIKYCTDTVNTCTPATTYSSSVSISTSGTYLRSSATATGFGASAVQSALYTIQVVVNPSITLAAGPYTGAQSTTITDATSGATICYTLNGSTPTASTPGTCDSNGGVEFTYSSSIAISVSETLEAIGTKSAWGNSGVTSALYTLTVSTPAYNNPGAAYTSFPTVTITDSTSGSAIIYCVDTTNTCTPVTAYSSPVAITAWNQYLRSQATLSGMTNSAVQSAEYVLLIATNQIESDTGNRAVCSSSCGSGYGLGSNWTQPDNYLTTYQTGPGLAGANTGGVPQYGWWSANSLNQDQYASINLTDVIATGSGVYVRATGTSNATMNGYYATYTINSGPTYTYVLNKLVSGVTTQLWSSGNLSSAVGNGSGFMLVAVGSTLTLYAGTSPVYQLVSITDTTFASGAAGVMTYGSEAQVGYITGWTGGDANAIPTPTLSVPGGAYSTLPTVTVSVAGYPNATINTCTAVGTSCTPSGSTNPVTIAATNTQLCYKATETGLGNAGVLCATYTHVTPGNSNVHVWILQ